MQNFKNVNFWNWTFSTMYGVLKCWELKSDQNKAVSVYQYFEGAQKIRFKTWKITAFFAD